MIMSALQAMAIAMFGAFAALSGIGLRTSTLRTSSRA
jgi:hypothetical protein